MNKYAILVNSCDAYSDLWEPFFYLLRRNWPESLDCNIYLNTETINKCQYDEKVICINTKPEKKDMWGKRLINALSSIQEKYVIVVMDDFFLRKQVNIDAINESIELLEKDDNNAVVYYSNTLSSEFEHTKEDLIVPIPAGTPYRLNTAPGIWKTKKLLKYIKKSDNPWAWEFFGTCRTNHSKDVFYTVWDKKRAVYDYAHAIYRGKWLGDDILPLVDEFNLSKVYL